MRKSLFGVAIVGLLATSGCSALSTANKVRNIANGNTVKEVEEFQTRAEAAKKLTYTAEYDSKSSGNSKAEKIRIVQKPPKSLYAQGESLFIDDGKRTITCSPDSSQGNKMQCIDVGASGANPGAFTQILSAPALLQSVALIAVLPGVSVKKSTRNLAGENLDCVRIEVDNKHAESCVTSDGVMGFYDGDDGNTFTLTSFKRSASDKDFDAPAKAVTAEELSKQLPDQVTSTTSRVTTNTSDSTSDSNDSGTSDTTDTTEAP